MTPFEWLRITRNGQLPPASMIGQRSPYFRYLPTATMQGPSSAFPRQMALPPAPTPQSAGGLVVQAAQSAGPQAAMGALGQGARALPAAPVAIPMGPVANPVAAQAAAASSVDDLVGAGAAAARGPVTSMTAAQQAARAGTVAFTPGNANAVLGPVKPTGLIGTAINNVKGVGLRGGLMRAGIPMLVGQVGGNMLDESSWLGGEDAALNDYASKALKTGGVGAAIGSLIAPGPGTAIGAGVGGLIGVGWEGLERAGVLKNPTVPERVAEQVSDVEERALNVGLPQQVLTELRRSHDAAMEFAEGDKNTIAALGDQYEQQVQEATLMYASDPEGFMEQMGLGPDGQPQDLAAQQLAMQAAMVNAVKPYADNFLAQSSATADALDNMAAGAGDLAPMYRQQAAQQRALGGMYAADLIQQAQISPYQQAARDQADYLKQISGNIMSQAIGQVMNPQTANAGSMDLTGIIDQYAGQLQPG